MTASTPQPWCPFYGFQIPAGHKPAPGVCEHVSESWEEDVDVKPVIEAGSDTTFFQEGVRVSYRLRDDDRLTMVQEIVLPSWASGDPQMAVALALFGYRDAAEDVTVIGTVDVNPTPKYLHSTSAQPDVLVGELVYWFGVNGHRFEGEVQRLWPDGSAQTPGINNSWHSGACGCHKEPWEYDPIDAY